MTGDGRSATVYDLSDFFQVAPVYQALRIVGSQLLPGAGGFQLTFSGPAGQTYQVLTSDNPATPRSAWQVLGTGTFGDTNAIFSDPTTTTHSNRFYRLTSP